jgi:flagellar biosynthesis regulator FlbT
MLQLPMTDPSQPLPFGAPRRTAVNRRKVAALPHQRRRALILALLIITQERVNQGQYMFALLLIKTFYEFDQELRVIA